MRFNFTSWLERPRAAVASLSTLVLAGAFALTMTGCSEGDTTGPPDDDQDGDGGAGTVTFFVGNAGQASATVLSRARASVSGAKKPVDIETLRMTLTSIEAHMVESASGTPPWVPVEFDPPLPELVFDPSAPPGDFEPVLTGELPQGEYNLVRLFAEEMWVDFADPSASGTPIKVGPCELSATEEHAAQRPGGNDKPILIPNVDLSVDGDGTPVFLVWDEDQIQTSVNVTGNCMILVRPVLHHQEGDGG